MNLKILKRTNLKKNNNYMLRLKNAEKSRYDCLRQNEDNNVFYGFLGFFINFFKRFFYISSYSVLFIVLSIAVENTFASVFLHNPFAVQMIDIQNNVVVEDEDILNICKIKTNENILKVNIFEIKKKIENIENIKSAEIIRELPGKLIIKVEERIPLLRMIIGGELLDINGNEVKVKDGYMVYKHLPVIDGVNINSFGIIVTEDLEKYNKSLNIFLKLKEYLNEKDVISKVHCFSEWSDYTLTNGINLRIPLDYDETIFQKIKVVLNDCYKKSAGLLPKLIDVRYNKNVFVKF